MKSAATSAGQVWDLSNCDREPIHIPGAIQEQGFLIQVDGAETIRYISENVRNFLGLEPASLLGRSLKDFLGASSYGSIENDLKVKQLEKRNPFQLELVTKTENKNFDVRALTDERGTIFEFEVSAPAHAANRYYQLSREAVTSLRSSKNLEDLYAKAIGQVRAITGFDRVIIYRFDSEWNGHVLAEEKGPRGDSYFDLHFPASDIPKQARDLYALNRLRYISDIHYRPSKILAEAGAAPLDLSRASLRGVSPIHIEYLKNMEATASMSVSLEKDDKLWGLISCTHLSGPLTIPFEARAVCELIGEIVSSLLPVRETSERIQSSHEIIERQARLLERMAEVDDVTEALLSDADAFLGLVDAAGGAVYHNGNFHVVGLAPDTAVLKLISEWFANQAADEVHAMTSLPESISGARNSQYPALGFLGFSISKARMTQVLWFRPEVAQTVKWGGNPTKPVEMAGGSPVLHPRKSFEAWKEVVRGKSLPWKPEQLEAAARLRTAVMGVVLQKVEKITALNQELQRSNAELDSFAYAASHDLKEPLRGIHNYSTILTRTLSGKLTDEESGRLQTIGRLTQRMEDLINSLLSYSQIGRAELAMRKNDLNEILKSAVDSVRTRLDESGTQLECLTELPTLVCDRVQVTEVFTNLISNAVKYNESSSKRITISAAPAKSGPLVISVRDNGIGISKENQQNIFKIFKRLHAKEKYGGGTGTGLTIAAKIIERHGGRIWVESNPGEGSVFHFTLGS